jgi:hypothetical protein
MPSRLTSAFLLILLAVFFFNTCVFGVALSTELYLHQQAQLEKIKNKKHKDIIELRISRELVETANAQFQWKKDWEFCWQNEMYDIEESHLEGDEWVFFVKHDTHEDKLRKKMERHAQDETTKRDTQSKKNLKCGSEFFERIEFCVFNTDERIQGQTEAASSYTVAHRSLPDPPPWLR